MKGDLLTPQCALLVSYFSNAFGPACLFDEEVEEGSSSSGNSCCVLAHMKQEHQV